MAILHKKTRSVPIVFAQIGDPVGLGFVASLARPGGNFTGFGNFEVALSAKWLELLKQVAPSVTRVAVLYDPANPESFAMTSIIEAAARSHNVQVFPAAVRDAGEIERTLDAFGREPNGGLIPIPGPLLVTNRDLVISVAIRHRLPNVYAYRYYPVSGGLASYGVDNIDPYRRAASYVDKSSKAKSPATFQSKCRPNSSWSSISKLRKSLASLSQKDCSPRPTR